MLKRSVLLSIVALAWGGSVEHAAAHELPYEFDGTHVAISIERFMGIEYTDVEGPGGSNTVARVLLNANDNVPTSSARFGFDVFLRRLSIGLAAGLTSEDSAIIAPRVGYLFGLTPTLGLWLRGGGFYAALPDPNPSYFGLTAEALFAWFPYPIFAVTFGPTLDVAFAEDDKPDFIAIGIPQVGVSAFF
ncbi:MAG TPA: hypothetical protein VJR89_02745 [Polyangiales bacterium]|nr:hypothetical protein [Polyangiales bacterium]